MKSTFSGFSWGEWGIGIGETLFEGVALMEVSWKSDCTNNNKKKLQY